MQQLIRIPKSFFLAHLVAKINLPHLVGVVIAHIIFLGIFLCLYPALSNTGLIEGSIKLATKMEALFRLFPRFVIGLPAKLCLYKQVALCVYCCLHNEGSQQDASLASLPLYQYPFFRYTRQ